MKVIIAIRSIFVENFGTHINVALGGYSVLW